MKKEGWKRGESSPFSTTVFSLVVLHLDLRKEGGSKETEVLSKGGEGFASCLPQPSFSKKEKKKRGGEEVNRVSYQLCFGLGGGERDCLRKGGG